MLRVPDCGGRCSCQQTYMYNMLYTRKRHSGYSSDGRPTHYIYTLHMFNCCLISLLSEKNRRSWSEKNICHEREQHIKLSSCFILDLLGPINFRPIRPLTFRRWFPTFNVDRSPHQLRIWNIGTSVGVKVFLLLKVKRCIYHLEYGCRQFSKVPLPIERFSAKSHCVHSSLRIIALITSSMYR